MGYGSTIFKFLHAITLSNRSIWNKRIKRATNKMGVIKVGMRQSRRKYIPIKAEMVDLQKYIPVKVEMVDLQKSLDELSEICSDDWLVGSILTSDCLCRIEMETFHHILLIPILIPLRMAVELSLLTYSTQYLPTRYSPTRDH